MGGGPRRTEGAKPQHLKAPGNWVLEQLHPPRGDLQEAPGWSCHLSVPWPCPLSQGGARGRQWAGYLRVQG